MENGDLYRMAAFSDSPEGGNPAGVWIGSDFPSDATMQNMAADVGYSETVFVVPANGERRRVRYFSPKAEVPFCGHATIAAGAVLGAEAGKQTYAFETQAGEVPVTVRKLDDETTVSLTSVATRHRPVSDPLLRESLELLGWTGDDIDPDIPPAVAYAGAWHLVLAVRLAERLENLSYPFERLTQLMQDSDLTTLQLVWREHAGCFHSRNPFPVGGVIEDPATGAAAAAFAGYLRDAGLISPPSSFEIRQGEEMGRPSRLFVDVPPTGGIVVSGRAVRLTE